jgi:uncharacterized protein (TIGR02001 family)
MDSGATRIRRVAAFCVIASALTGVSHASAEWSGHVALTSEYIYRGLSWSDGNPALQAGVDYEHDGGFFGGLWASSVDLSNNTGRRDIELDYYAGYHFPSESAFAVSAALVLYTYPDDSGNFDYDYAEALLTASFADNYSLEIGYTDDAYGFGTSSHHVEVRGNWDTPAGWVVSAGLGSNDLGDRAPSSYFYWDVGASARFSRLTLDLRWFDNESEEGIVDRLGAGSKIVGTLSVAF